MGGAVSSETAHNSFGAKVVHHFTRFVLGVVSNATFKILNERKYHSMI
jgi:hypothetical protein